METLDEKIIDLKSRIQGLSVTDEKDALIRELEDVTKIANTKKNKFYEKIYTKYNCSKEDKLKRDENKKIYDKKNQIKKDVENDDTCTFLFFHKDLIEKYENLESLGDLRQDKIFLDIYERLIKMKKVRDIESKIKIIEDSIENMNEIYLEDSLEEYKECAAKFSTLKSQRRTKNNKENLSNIMENIEKLSIKTGLNLGKYLSIKFNYEYHDDECFNNVYLSTLKEYNRLKIQLKEEGKYVTNTLSNLKNAYMEYLYQKNYKETNKIQKGKYFKKWKDLEEDEKLERIRSYIEYLGKKNKIDEEKTREFISTVMKNIDQVYIHDIRWNSRKGMILNMKCIQIDTVTDDFFMIKSSVSVQTSLDTVTMNTINETMLLYAMNLKKLDQETDRKRLIEYIREKVNLKRIPNSDKKEIYKRFDKIKNIIDSN